MIIEFCGLPATGKTTFVKKLTKYLTDIDHPYIYYSSPRLYDPLQKNESLIYFKILCKLLINIFNNPLLFASILLCRMPSNRRLKTTLYRMIISLQYHYHWINFRSKINNKSNQDQLIILDGSPLNILNELVDPSAFNKILLSKKIYNSDCNENFIFYAYPEITKNYYLMQARIEQNIEKKLYKNIDDWGTIHTNFLLTGSLINPDSFIKLNLFNIDIEYFYLKYIQGK